MTLAVHRDALILRNSGSFVVKIDDDNTAHRVPVQIGQGQGDWLAIEQPGLPLKAGDRVAIRGAEMLKEGDRVVIQAVTS